jgi:hypothetical protein
MIDEIKAALAELEHEGMIERTGEMRWSELSREWEAVYTHTEHRRALLNTGISLSDYYKRAS